MKEKIVKWPRGTRKLYSVFFFHYERKLKLTSHLQLSETATFFTTNRYGGKTASAIFSMRKWGYMWLCQGDTVMNTCMG